MQNFLEEADLLRRQTAKIAKYLHNVIRRGDVPAAKANLLELGPFGQLVALALSERLTARERARLAQEMSGLLADTTSPRTKARRSFDQLAELSEASPK